MRTSFGLRHTRLMAGLLVIAGVAWLSAGDLNPPAGPVAPTMKPLDVVEPRIAINATNTPGDADSIYKITQPGSYYLTGNIAGVSAKMGIEIAASGVTLDLMGFELAGVVGSLQGIRATVANTQSIAIRNGAVRNWGGTGIDLQLSRHNQLTELRVLSNGLFGIHGSDATRVTHCTSSSNASGGMQLANAAVVTGCTLQSNGGHGVFATLTAVITQCAARLNGGTGINVTSGSNVTDCTSTENTGKGVSAGDASTISQCTIFANQGVGITAGQSCTITQCAVRLNTGGDGIEIGNNCHVSACTVVSNTGNGINAASVSATVSDCRAVSNNLHGITISGGVVTGCEASANNLDGIRVGSALVTGNRAFGNGVGTNVGAGIRVTGSGAHIENNLVGSNDVGIDVDSAPNVVIHNSSRSNAGGNYEFSPGNMTGTIMHQGVIDPNTQHNTYGNLSF